MQGSYTAPWHKASFDHFVNQKLPELLAAKLPLAGYNAEQVDDYTCRVTISIDANDNEFNVIYDILSPDNEGIFRVDDRPRVVVPIASSAHLDKAEIKCVGEQLYDYIEERIGETGHDTPPPDEDFIRTILPLDMWVRSLITSADGDYDHWATGQAQDTTNWLAAIAHLRRILIEDIEDVVTPSQFGRVCPFQTPEGPNIGHIFSMALGARIENGKIEIFDNCPSAKLGLSASTVPLLEHNNPVHQLMGVNMMRQWIPPINPEQAMVQTSNEPDVPDFWCGYNLLTAFIFWGPETYEDGIIISESAAKRMHYDIPVEVGDKFSNRHGAKGVIGNILPDDEMPHMTDGTPVELVFSFCGIDKRLNFGQIREALLGRIAYAEGKPIIAPPFEGPSESELKERLAKSGLPDDGMETLTNGKDGEQLARRSTVGWVYWGRTVHIASYKIHYAVSPDERLNLQGEYEYHAMRDIGAYANIAETYNLRSVEREDSHTLAKRAAEHTVELPGPTTPMFDRLKKHLNATGISADFTGNSVEFKKTGIEGDRLNLACAVRDPWSAGHEVTEVGVIENIPEYQSLVDINDKMRRLLATKAPDSLKSKLKADLETAIEDYFDALISHKQMCFFNQVLFSGRTVLSPASDLHADQVGIPDEMARALFGPFVEKKTCKPLKDMKDDEASQTIDEIMADSWLIINRAPTFMPTCLLAFHPIRVPGRSIRLHQIACMLLNSDNDGDQAAVFLPLTDEAQREAGELMSIAGHLRRDHSLIRWISPTNEAMWGLAQLSRSTAGLDKIETIIGAEIGTTGCLITRDKVISALSKLLGRDGVDAAISACEQLMRLGFEVCKSSGASLSPFAGSSLKNGTEVDKVTELIESDTDFDSDDIGPQLISAKSGARSSVESIRKLIGPYGQATDASNSSVYISGGFRDGMKLDQIWTLVGDTRKKLSQVAQTLQIHYVYGAQELKLAQGYGVLARAMRSEKPGVVFANAAVRNETDPLADIDSRLFVGLQTP
ncbi:hypothetical protein LLG46_04150 [bacterium]|nr:hypothetical protein [bacterium]